MTNIEMDRLRVPVSVSKPLITVISILLMGLGLVASSYLLKWAVTDKLARTEPMQSSPITASVRDRQLNCLAKNIYHEAGNEPFEGLVAVAQVTMNRAASGLFPNDICQVVYQKNTFYEKVVCQFSWYCDRAATLRPIHKDTYDASMEAAKKVLLEGFRLPSLTNAMYYHATYIDPGWNRKKIIKIGRHIFYE